MWELDDYETDDLKLAASYIDGLESMGFGVSEDMSEAIDHELNKRDEADGNN